MRGARRSLAGALVALALAMVVGERDASAGVCFFDSTVTVSFGTYDVFSTTAIEAAGSVTYRCSPNTSVAITLNTGLNATTFFPRYLANGIDKLSYNLYLDTILTKVWGDGTGGSVLYSNPAQPKWRTITVPVFGRLPAGQDVSAGPYSDTVTITMNF
ncbi:MAG: spore coat U domain-containing protein [Pseudomonadota bacterium]